MPQAKSPTPYDDFALYYDPSNLDRAPEIAFYTGLIRNSDRAMLELACGTGKITTKMADQLIGRHGAAVRIAGVDESSKMLDIARARDPRIEWIQGDMRTPPVAGPFDLVICPFNVLQLILTDEDMTLLFRSVRAMLNADGLFAFDIFQPNVEYLNSWPAERIVRTVEDPQGRSLYLYESARYDAAAKILSHNWRVQLQGDANGPPVARLHSTLRQYFADEIEQLLHASGLRIKERFGDMQKSPFTPKSKKQIVVCSVS